MKSIQYGVYVNYEDMSFEEVSFVTRVFAQMEEFGKTTGKCHITVQDDGEKVLPPIIGPSSVAEETKIAAPERTYDFFPGGEPTQDISKTDIIHATLLEADKWLPLSEIREKLPQINYNSLGALLHQMSERGRLRKDMRPTGKGHGRTQRAYYRAA
jgi:hypothetical protein